MASRIRIAIDCMGGDQGLRSSLPAAKKSLALFSDIEITLVGDSNQIESEISTDDSRINILHAPEVVLMSDKPSHALRRKSQSSMRMAIDLLHENKVDAVVSAGNTGALLAIGCYVLKTLPGIDRPAICSAIPSRNGHSHLLDLGANVDSSADNLYQFAVMGSALAASVDGNQQPKVALLNIGEEDIKGNEQVKLAAKLMQADESINFIGSIEGDALFSGDADVIVCDGFVGNVALKVSEGTARHISSLITEKFKETFWSKLSALLSTRVLNKIYRTLNPEKYNGASFLGLQGVLVKSHGNSSVESFVQAIAKARAEVEAGMLALIDQKLADRA